MSGWDLPTVAGPLPRVVAEQGSCRTLDLAIFFDDDNPKPAQRVCYGCPVRQECLDYALDTHQDQGVWGSMTPKQRKDHANRERKRSWRSARRVAGLPVR